MNSTICCPSCQRTLRVPESLLGQAVKCPSCSRVFTVPESVEAEIPRRAAPPSRHDNGEPRLSRRRSHDDEDDVDYEDRPRRRYSGKPSKVQAIAIMVLIGGILALVYGLSLLVVGAFSCIGLIWPGTYYAIVLGVMGLAKGIQLLGDKAYKEAPPQGIAIMMIINIINCDLTSFILGILVLVFLGDEDVKDYFS